LKLLSQAEFEMEMYFSLLLGREDKLDLEDLRRFWYRENYRDLIRQEIRGLEDLIPGAPIAKDDRPIIFVGAGPLPLSAIDYYLQLGKPCVCIEKNAQAAKAGQALIDKLGLGEVIRYIEADGCDIDYGDYSLVMVASLVANKAGVMARVHETQDNALVGVRSADGLKTLLYDPVDEHELEKQGFHYRGVARADNKTVNSTCFFTSGRPKAPELKLV